MMVKDLAWKHEDRHGDNIFFANSEGYRFSILDRLTGWSGGIRDIETGLRDSDGKFWLASGNFDIRKFPELEILEAVDFIKENANTCVGI